MSIVQIIGRTGGTSSQLTNISIKIENVSSQVNGSNINFSTADTFIEDTVQVTVNGLIQTPSEDYTEDTDKQGITFGQAPESGDKVIFQYVISS